MKECLGLVKGSYQRANEGHIGDEDIKMEWIVKSFEELTNSELYRILQLRSAVFVVEQNCVYQDIDGYDIEAAHLFVKKGEDIIACSRLLPAGTVYKEEASFGRIVVDLDERKGGFGRDLVSKSLDVLIKDWKETRIKIQAQVYIKHFYRSFGFKEVSEAYLEDGIPHVDMLFVVE